MNTLYSIKYEAQDNGMNKLAGLGNFNYTTYTVSSTSVNCISESQFPELLIFRQKETDRALRPIDRILEALSNEVPPEEWERLPADLTDNLDHYVYGIPRQ